VGDVHASTLHRAWQSVLDRHEILRTLFVWKRQKKPLQIVRPQVVLPWKQLDWLGLSAGDQEAELESFLLADRKQGFDLSTAPLMRMTLIHTAENRHELIWTTHHLLLDGWSTFLVIKDAAAIYGALREGRQLDLPHCRPYSDYISWLQRQDLSKAEDFWRVELKGFSTPTPFSVDRPAPTSTNRGDDVASEQQQWPAELMEALRTFGARHSLTSSTLVHGAWAALLSRYSGEADVLFGSVVAGRPADFAGVESMVGLFINTLPVRARVPPAASVLAWLKDLQDHLVGVRQFEHSSLVDVQGWSEVPRDRPLFESLLAFENYPVNASMRQQDADVEIANLRVIEQTNYPLAVTVVPGDDLVVRVGYRSSRFDAATITRLLGHFRALLEAIVSSPDGQVSDLSMLSEGEHRRLLEEWNPPAVAYPGGCLHELIEEQARRTPDQVAVVFEDETATYAALDRRATRLARHLRGLGVGPEVRVGLCVERSLDTVVGLLGILKAGAAYVPMDAGFPQERIAFMLSDANAGVVLTQTRLLARLPTGPAQVVCLDGVEWTDAEPRPDPPGDPGTLAYVIYTSGSTGRPKGVGVEHRNIVNYVLGVADRLRLTPGMQHAMVSTIAADLGNTVLFPALVTGGCLHIIAQERGENQTRLAEYFRCHQIDVLKIVPSHLAALQTGPHPERVMPRRRLILGGEASRLEWVERLRGWAPTCEIHNHYGPTETTVGVLTYPLESQVPRTRSGTLPIGRPLPNSRVYILDPRDQPVPIGVHGELCIGGRGVARGYLNRPELTAEKFGVDPFSPEPGGRLYRTGDRARYLPDGTIEFCGRFDHQVKIHGYRIELGEIEAVLREQRGVRDAVVVAHDAEDGTKQLVAYVVPNRAQLAARGLAVHVLPDGSEVAHLNSNETAYIYNEIFVLQAYLRHGITIHDGDCVVDAGANIGLFTVFASRLARNVRVLAFEPNPAAFACLQANAEAWGTNVQCLPVGLSHANRSADLTFFEGFSLLSGFYADAATEREVVKTYALNQASASPDRGHLAASIDELLADRFNTRTETAHLRTLSSVIAEERLTRIDLLKINVEKSEVDVLLGLGSEDWPKIRQLVIEVDQQAHVEPITALLEQQGYEVLVEQDPLLRNTQLCYVYAIRPSAGRRLVRHQPADAHLRSLPPVADDVVRPATLRGCLTARLPSYMIPALFVLLDAFPLTGNGKIDRKALPAPNAGPVAATEEYVAPRDALEQALARVWSRILKVKRVGVHDNFFELGGHSLAAIRLSSEVQELTGRTLPLASLFDAPTVARLADILRGDGWAPSWSSLVPIQTRGSKHPLFLVHAAHGNVLLYRQMSRHFGPNQPVYGLQSEGLNGDGHLNATVEEMASRYVKEIVTVQPHGPYFLGGYCLGGVIALEIAQQLTASGEKVEGVILLDTYNVAVVSRAKLLLCAPVHWLQNLWFHGANSASIRGKEREKFLREKVDIAVMRLGIRLRAARHACRRLLSRKTHHRDANLAVKRINDRAASRYVPRPYDGRVILIRSRGYFLGFASPSLGWRDILHGDFIVRELPVYPKGMLIEPYCRVLAEAIEMCLDQSRSRAA
jgi:amino acid adenylation domain-containing protein/FkbM family methyltransferase